MKLTKQSQNKLNKFRVLLKKTKKNLWLNQPKWSVLLDAKTEPHRIIISYSIDLEKWINGKQSFYKKKKFLYLKNRTLDDFDLFISEIEKHHDTITDLVSSAIEKLESVSGEDIYNELSQILLAEIYDYILEDWLNAKIYYLSILQNFPNSIHYEQIRLRLKEMMDNPL